MAHIEQIAKKKQLTSKTDILLVYLHLHPVGIGGRTILGIERVSPQSRTSVRLGEEREHQNTRFIIGPRMRNILHRVMRQ